MSHISSYPYKLSFFFKKIHSGGTLFQWIMPPLVKCKVSPHLKGGSLWNICLHHHLMVKKWLIYDSNQALCKASGAILKMRTRFKATTHWSPFVLEMAHHVLHVKHVMILPNGNELCY
jgi:hypothetical protein